MLGKNPGKRFLWSTYGLDLALKLSRGCLRIISTAWYKRAFPAVRLVKRTIEDFETSMGGGRLSTSVGGVITWRGPDIIIVDDPMKADDALRNRVVHRRLSQGSAQVGYRRQHCFIKVCAVRGLLRSSAVLAALCLDFPAAATVAPPTAEQIVVMKKRAAFEDRARTAFGDSGLIEKLRDWRKNWGFILVGEEGPRKRPRLLIKDEYGWYEMGPGQTRRIPVALGLELNRLLAAPDLWAEEAYNLKATCGKAARLFVIMHAGQDKFGRAGCGPEGLAARVARTADALRVLPGEPRTTAPAREEPAGPVGASPEYYAASRQVSGQLFEMAAAWERKTLAGFVEPYAPDVILEGPFGTYRGRKMVVDWARHLQDWNAPYSPTDKRLKVERIVTMNQPAKDVFYSSHELRWEEAGKLVRQTFSTLWRNHGGQWLIAHEKMSDVKPVTDERVRW